MGGTRILKVALLLLASASSLAVADDVSGASKLLCYVGTATVCLAEGECVTVPAWTLNIPEFVEVDLDSRIIRTTKDAAENRETEIANVQRAKGVVIFQGAQEDRGISGVLEERSGFLSIAVAGDGLGVVGFGACTRSR